MAVEVTRLRFEEAADARAWQAFVGSRADSRYTDLPAWRLLFRELYGFENHAWLATADGVTTGALSLYHVRSPLMGRMLVTNPFFGTGGFYWDDEAAREALVARALETARGLGVDFVELRLGAELPAPFAANRDFADFDLELADTLEATWTDRLASNVRQNVRKARKQPLEFRLTDDHGPCFALLCRTLRAHGTPFHGERFFRLLRRHLGEHVRFAEVRHDGGVVAAGVVVRYAKTLATPYIGSLASHRALRPNYLQYWKLVEHCFDTGLERFEMGRSPRDSTHERFKKKWGCREIPLVYNHVLVNPRKRYRSVSRPSRTQILATRVWRQLPLGVTKSLGPMLFRHIP